VGGSGGGGGGYFNADPGPVQKALRVAQQQTDSAEYDSECNVALQSLLPVINDLDREKVSDYLEKIKSILEKELDGTIPLRYGGSVAKHTYVDGLSDVDSLLLLDNCKLAEAKPKDAREFLAGKLRDGLPEADVTQGRLAVTAKFKDAEIQLLPAVSCRGGVTISDATGDNWSKIQPREFANILSRTNESQGGKLVPTIKLAKAIIANMPDSNRITGYHAESLGVKIFRNYAGPRDYKNMLKHYFEQAATHSRAPIRDSTGQSVHVDDYLGREGSLERRIVSDAFARVARRMTNADVAQSVTQWTTLFEP
jgi:hypothetical protein